MALTYKNPVWDGYFADPFILRSAHGYTAYGTGPVSNTDRREFPVLRSPDLVHWTYVGGALTPLGNGASSYWAPEVAERDGAFFMYYSAGGDGGAGHQVRVATAAHPEGPFTDTGNILLPDEPFSIDAHPFRDPKDGRWYLFFAKDYFVDGRAGTGIAVVPLSDDMLHASGPVHPVVRATADWQIFKRNRTWYGRTWEAWHTVEGPFVVEHNGRYFCLYSGGPWDGDLYGVGFCVADNPLGPYVDEWDADGPSVLRGVPGHVLGPGHNSVVIGPDGVTQYVAYHAWDAALTARRLCIDPLVWTPDGPRCEGPSY